jgi:nucleotide-binding universal stress UspA family protein
MLRRLLVPLDGSPLAEQALPLALSVARKAQSEIHLALVHVPAAYDDAVHWEELDDEVKAREHQYLEALRCRICKAFSGTVQVHHVEGLAPETLASEIDNQQIDLVVMNAHGWGYVTRAITGSVSDYLLRHVNVPLLLMHSGALSRQFDVSVSLRNILICLDGSALAETALGPATNLGRLWESRYHLLRVAPPPQHVGRPFGQDEQSLYQHARDRASADARDYLERIAERLRTEAAPATTRVVLNRNVAQAVIDEALANGCDLIAISTHGRGGVARLLLGSVADKVIRGSHTPVLVYRPPA